MKRQASDLLGVTFNGNVTFQGPMFDIHDNKHVHINVSKQAAQGGVGNVGDVPRELMTEEAMTYWQKLRDEGFIVADGFALAKGVSNNQATYIAYRFSEKLGLEPKWKPFMKLWGIQNMAQLARDWKVTGKQPPRAEVIDDIFEVKPDKPKGFVKVR